MEWSKRSYNVDWKIQRSAEKSVVGCPQLYQIVEGLPSYHLVVILSLGQAHPAVFSALVIRSPH